MTSPKLPSYMVIRPSGINFHSVGISRIAASSRVFGTRPVSTTVLRNYHGQLLQPPGKTLVPHISGFKIERVMALAIPLCRVTGR